MQVISDGIQFCCLHTPIKTKSRKLCAHEHDRVTLLIEDVRVVPFIGAGVMSLQL